jgi:signal transduction histidine kinase
MHYTDGPTSPFFLFYNFALIAATLRWSWRGALATAVVLTATLLLVTYVDASVSRDFGTTSNRVILRAGHLVIAGAMLAYLGAFLERSRNRLAQLAAWPEEEVGDGQAPVLDRSLHHAADVIGAERIVVVWDNRDEPALQTAHWTGESCKYGRRPEQRLRDLVALELGDASFHSTGPGDARVTLPTGVRRVVGATVEAGFAKEFDVAEFCSAPLGSSEVKGRLFILAPGPFTPGLLHLTEIAAVRIAAELEQFGLRSALSMAAIVRERVRLARDLHDGVLQDLTAARLMIKPLADSSTAKVKTDLQEISGILAQQQQRIRSFVRTANPKPAADWDFAAEFRTLAATLQRQWQCEVVAELRPPELVLPGSIGFQVFLIFGEAMANAVQHGRSRRITVTIERNSQVLHMLFRDDGHGLPDRPGGEAPGPFSLRQRIADLGGTLRLSSSAKGVELAIELPIP